MPDAKSKTRIPIQPLKDLAKKFGLTHVILLAHQDGSELDHVVTYGKTVEQCSQAADFGNRLKEALGWPASLFAQPSRVKKLQAQLEKAEAACKTLMRYEYAMDGCDDGSAEPIYWQAVREAREAVGDHQPDTP